MKALPKQKPRVIIRKIGNEAMLYDTDREMVHILNDTAEVVWNLCNGESQIKDVEKKLQKLYTFSQNHDLKADIMEILSNFSELGLTVK